jgi:hypothetical protein
MVSAFLDVFFFLGLSGGNAMHRRKDEDEDEGKRERTKRTRGNADS